LDPKYIDPVPVTQKVIEGGDGVQERFKIHMVFHKMTVVDDRVSPVLIGEDIAF